MSIGKQFLEKLDHAGLSLLGDRVHCFLKGGLKTNMPFLELEIYDNISQHHFPNITAGLTGDR